LSWQEEFLFTFDLLVALSIRRIKVSANQEAKKIAVEEIKDLISNAKSIVLVDYKGITVAQDTALRKDLRANNITYKVIKNTLFKKACEQLGITGFDEALNGTTAFAFGVEDETAAPRLVKKAMKEYNTLSIKAGYYNGAAVDVKTVETLASVPSKEQLVAQLLYVLNAPVASLARAFKAIAEKE
jgi:large subunit ribosomal protein L10